MKYFFTLVFVSAISWVDAQQPSVQPGQYLQISGGSSKHGSGDLKGILFSTEYGKYFRKNISWSLRLSGTIHDGYYPLEFLAGGQTIDGSIRYTVAGVQLGANLGYSIFRNDKHELLTKGGALLRYQSSSLPDYYEIAYPAATGLPYPVIIYNHSTRQRTYTVGADVQMQYSYSIKQKWFIGLLGGFQFDTGGDNVSQISLATGFRL